MGQAKVELNKARRGAWCFAAEFDAEGCEGKIIRAHAVQKSRALDAIAVGGHVEEVVHGKEGRVFQEVGVNKASVFRGFCAAHDNAIFVPVDDGVIRPTREQAFLLCLRALAHECHKKAVEIAGLAAVGAGHRSPEVDNQQGADLLEDFRQGNILGASDMAVERKRAWRQLQTGDLSGVGCVAFRTREVPEIVGAGWVSAEYDFHGRRAQDLAEFGKPFSGTAFFCLPAGDGGGVVGLAWLARTRATNLLLRSAMRLSVEDAPSALLRFGVSLSENMYYRPSFRAGMSESAKSWLLSRAELGGGPNCRRIGASTLLDDNVRLATWTVVERVVVQPTAAVE